MHNPHSTRRRGDSHGTVRSATAMKGLLLAEIGDGMVRFDVGCEGSGFMTGSRVIDDAITPGGSSRIGPSKASSHVGNLARHGTLITENASPKRLAVELQRLLGNSNAKLKAGEALLPPPGGTSLEEIQMEQAKPRARVKVDLVLDNHIFVQGTDVRGHAIVNVHKPTKMEGPVLLHGGKVRAIGYESILGTKMTHSFYHCSVPISIESPYFHGDALDKDHGQECMEVLEGTYRFPLRMRLPLSDEKGCAKGVMADHSGAAVRYIIVVSFKVKDAESKKQSVAHFYRSCEVWPRLDLTKFLSPAPRPLRATISKPLLMGGEGKLILTAGLVRLYWVSGQRCFVQIGIQNETKKTVTCVTLTLLRNTVIFRPQPQLDILPVSGASYGGDPDACQASTTTKIVAESILEAGDKATRRHASAKGWWTGVPPKSSMDLSHSIVIPSREVTIPRGRLLEVEYTLKVTLSVGMLLTTDVQVSLPIRLINFVSLDPHISSVLHATLKDSILSCNDLGSRVPMLEQDPDREQAPNESGTQLDETKALELGDSSMIGTIMRENDEDSEVLGSLLLGDLSTVNEADEALEVAASVRLGQVDRESAPRFTDLYYTCMLDSQEPRRPLAKRKEELPIEPSYTGAAAPTEEETGKDAAIADKTPGPAAASFANRVEEKLRAVGKSCSRPASEVTGIEVSCSKPLSIDDLLSSMATTTKADNELTLSQCADRDLVTTAAGSSGYMKISQREICGKSGLVRSKIQELEQRLGAASK